MDMGMQRSSCEPPSLECPAKAGNHDYAKVIKCPGKTGCLGGPQAIWILGKKNHSNGSMTSILEGV